MNKLKVGDTLVIHCYKHNGVIYESSRVAFVLDIKDDYIVLGDENVQITKQDGRTWHTKGSAIMFFYKKRWFNIIAQLKEDGTFYYCNIASPFVIDDHALKYIDYDLDLRIFPKGEYKILDKLEYQYHKKKMNYSKDLDIVINNAMKELIGDYLNNSITFSEDSNKFYLSKYLDIKTNAN